MDSMNETDYSLVNLIDDNPKYKELKEKLSGLKKGSDEYFLELYEELPLSSWPNYKKFLKKQALPIKDDSSGSNNGSSGYSDTFRSSLSPEKMVSCLDTNKMATFFDHFQFSVRNFPENDCLGVRAVNEETGEYENFYVYQSYETVNERAKNLASGLMTIVNSKRKVKLTNNDFIVSILSFNRPEWIILDIACQFYSLTNTSLYETLGPETSEYILNLTESPVLFFAKSNLYKIIDMLPELKYLNTLVCMDDLPKEELDILNSSVFSKAHNANNETINLFNLTDIENIGKISAIPISPPKSDDIYTISFTSGTTGVPKGVEMSQRNIAAGIAFGLSTFKNPSRKKGLQLHDVCFLPLAHIFQRMIMTYDLSRGMGIGFLHKPDPLVLVDDLKALQPDVASFVPRILTKFETGIKNALEKSGFQKTVASNIIGLRQSRVTSKGGHDRSAMNYLVYHRVLIDKIRESLGLTNATYLITGSAPISNSTLLFLKSSLDVGLRQGYGLTESFAGISLSEPFERDSGSCGAIGISSECRLKSVPSMGYDAQKDLKGELQLRGPQIFKKYFKKPNETSEVLDKDGWFSTGDVAYIDQKGRLYVIDRVKNFFKLSQGEYVAPEKIENTYLSSCPLITQVFVYGDSLHSFLTGIIGIDPEAVVLALKEEYPLITTWSDETLIDNMNKDPAMKRSFLVLMNSYLKTLQGFEKLHNISVSIEPLKITDNVITPTLKIKRAKASVFFKPTLTALYDEGSLLKNGKL